MHTEFLVGKPEGKKPFVRLRRRWEDNFGMVLRHTGLEIVYWICLPEDRDQCWVLMNTVMSLRVP
jgi:hypothetical protein